VGARGIGSERRTTDLGQYVAVSKATVSKGVEREYVRIPSQLSLARGAASGCTAELSNFDMIENRTQAQGRDSSLGSAVG
jgi:hypothetical protein